MHTTEMTPTERLAAKIADLEAQLELANERTYWLVAEIAGLQAKLGNTDFKTQP